MFVYIGANSIDLSDLNCELKKPASNQDLMN